MKQLFDSVSYTCSKTVTKKYSTSFSLAVNLLGSSIRKEIHNIYGFVRFADEIVDSFHGYNKEYLLQKFEDDLKEALEMKISLNPILNSFQHTVHKYAIDYELIEAFLQSMRMDLYKQTYTTQDEYKKYIYGSADVVGLMCLKVFVDGDKAKFESLKKSAMSLGSAFQKVNFLRDLKNDMQDLERSYFPHIDLNNLNNQSKKTIINEIEEDFRIAYEGIIKLPAEAKFGVYTAYRYYKRLLSQLKATPSEKIMSTRIRVSNPLKMGLLAESYLNIKLNLV